MKVKNLSALAGLGGALILSTSAQAGYTGLELVDVTSFFNDHPNANVANAFNPFQAAGDLKVWRLFATFNGNTVQDRVNIVYGNAASPANFTVIDGSIYNVVDGTGTPSSPFVHFNLPPASFSAGANAGRAFETWASIGAASGTTTQFAPGTEAEVNNFSGNWTATNSAWFITPDNTQGAAQTYANQGSAGPKVLLMQIAIFDVEGTNPGDFSGSINVQTGFGNSLGQTFATPAPGALALLGLAGLVGSRRRRA